MCELKKKGMWKKRELNNDGHGISALYGFVFVVVLGFGLQIRKCWC